VPEPEYWSWNLSVSSTNLPTIDLSNPARQLTREIKGKESLHGMTCSTGSQRSSAILSNLSYTISDSCLFSAFKYQSIIDCPASNQNNLILSEDNNVEIMHKPAALSHPPHDVIVSRNWRRRGISHWGSQRIEREIPFFGITASATAWSARRCLGRHHGASTWGCWVCVLTDLCGVWAAPRIQPPNLWVETADAVESATLVACATGTQSRLNPGAICLTA
jgi:hypothetical protein